MSIDLAVKCFGNGVRRSIAKMRLLLIHVEIR